jgi:uncharacterized membrane protein YcaP (DUF421 family)
MMPRRTGGEIATMDLVFLVIERLTSAPPLPVVRDGKLLRRNMRREFLTEEELMNHLRQQGFSEVKDVKEAYVESEGKITVIGKEK